MVEKRSLLVIVVTNRDGLSSDHAQPCNVSPNFAQIKSQLQELSTDKTVVLIEELAAATGVPVLVA